jgi:hypothetical protein
MKTATQIMGELSGTLQSFNKGEQADILDKLGIDPSMIQLLNKSSSEMAALREEARSLGTITQEQADAAASLNDANTTLRFGLTGLKNNIAVGMAPVVQGITEGFIEFLMAHKDLIANGVKKLGEAIVILGGFIRRITPFVLVAAGAFGIWALATGGLATAMGVLLSPVVLIAAGILAIALVVDDLVVAFNGGNSVIGNFIKQLTGFDIGEAMRNAAASVKKFISDAIKDFKSLLNFMDNISLGGAFDGLAGALGFGGEDGADGQSVGFQGGNSGAIDRGTTNNNASSSNVEQNNNINVYSSDPAAAGKAVASVQSNNLRETKQYFNRGGM